MDINERAAEAVEDSDKWFPNFLQDEETLAHLMLCLAGEVGECCNLVKKYVRGSMTMDQLMKRLPEEMIDVQTYLFNAMGYIHRQVKETDWEAEYDEKRIVNGLRFT